MSVNIEGLDIAITEGIYNFVNNNNLTRELPYYLGLLPYEIYVLPGMFIAMIQVILYSSYNPIQFHLLPHFFAFSLFQLIKGTVGRERPGCSRKSLGNFIDKSHCSGKQRFLSFPSGHTGIAFALATALYLEMNHSSNPKFFDIEIKDKKNQKLISYLGIFVAVFISIHRISKGYHYFSDTLVGGILGSTIGYVTWKILERYKRGYYKYCEKDKKSEVCSKDEKSILEIIFKLLLLVPILFLLIKFVIIDIRNLASVKH